MPRGPRLDAPGVLHHVMARGIERRQIFWDDHDRDDFVDRLAGLVKDGALTVYAWAFIPSLPPLGSYRPATPFPQHELAFDGICGSV